MSFFAAPCTVVTLRFDIISQVFLKERRKGWLVGWVKKREQLEFSLVSPPRKSSLTSICIRSRHTLTYESGVWTCTLLRCGTNKRSKGHLATLMIIAMIIMMMNTPPAARQTNLIIASNTYTFIHTYCTGIFSFLPVSRQETNFLFLCLGICTSLVGRLYRRHRLIRLPNWTMSVFKYMIFPLPWIIGSSLNRASYYPMSSVYYPEFRSEPPKQKRIEVTKRMRRRILLQLKVGWQKEQDFVSTYLTLTTG